MKVLLINPFISTHATAGKYRRFLEPMPPISLAYVAAALKRAGVEVAIYDDYTRGGDRAALMTRIRDESPDIAGLTCVTPTAERTMEIAQAIKQDMPGVKLMMGNIHASVFYEQILNENMADYVVLGEGEDTVADLVHTLEAGGDLAAVQGIAWKRDGRVVANEPRPYREDLDSFPFPAWELFPLQRYRLFSFAVVQEPGALVLGSRGCPYNCTFCSLKIMGRKRRRRSTANIVDECEWLLHDFGYKQMSFIDPIFPFSKDEGIEFSNELTRRGLHKKIVWTTETRVDLVDQELLDAMAASGLRRIMYGFESGGQAGIDSIKKSFKIDQARSAVAMTKKAGVEIIGFFMLGVPGETVASADQTINYSVSLNIDFAKFTIFSPFPGTKVYEDMLADGTIKETRIWSTFTNYPSKETPAAYIPEALTNDDLIRLQRKAFLKFYLRPRQVFNQLLKVRTLSIKDMWNGLLLVLGLH
jgi:radical SAM superfamily enzyme YgiQ (UPF0313 family)